MMIHEKPEAEKSPDTLTLNGYRYRYTVLEKLRTSVKFTQNKSNLPV